MVPLLSQLWYRSRCRYCGQRFSWRYFWVELFTGLMFAAIYLRYVPFGSPEISEAARTWSSAMGMAFAASLITLFFIDLEHYEIPDVCILIAVAAGISKDVFLIATGSRDLWHRLPGTELALPIPLSILGGLIAFWALWQFAALGTAALGREAMGAGDSLLLGAMGAFLIPWPLVLLAFMVAVFLGTVGGVVGMALARKEESAGRPDPEPASGEVPEPPQVNLSAVDAEPVPAGLDLSASHRGAADGGGEPQPDEDPVPDLPPSSRWGRLITVLGSWVAVGALWVGAALGAGSPAAGIGAGLGLAVAAAVLLYFGIRMWKQGDAEWLPAMDELFEEGDPGPRFIPFGPYLVAGTFFAMLFGQSLVQWYARWQLSMDLSMLPWD
jgi:prepilin signal peptidase PulO-like enzyme (type II secretory pathway)